ncbi:MAG: DUF1501 domain-containing protein [Gammaproteobacteria bacterium]|nr:DUF1501 domain-containing protein [Gammaproteobacteria bacterium]
MKSNRMTRRLFMQRSTALGLSISAPGMFGLPQAGLAAPPGVFNDADFRMPSVLPQVINVFLYGGPSELAGNLTNIARINANSQNPYPNGVLQTLDENGQITRNGFWRDAGGLEMEDMLASRDLSIYRTINRRKENTQAHRPSVFSSLKGSLSIEDAPGMGSTLAAFLNAHRDQLDGSDLLRGRQLTNMVLPFISFEGTTPAFQADPDGQLPLTLRGLSLDERFDNPYTRDNNDNDIALEALIRKVVNKNQQTRYTKVVEGFDRRRNMEELIGNLQNAADNPLPMPPPQADGSPDPDVDPATGSLVYPGNNSFSGRLKAAVTLAVQNPDSLFITVGGGLGGWDDHSSAIEDYVPRMQQLMRALRVAVKHIRYSDMAYGGTRNTDNIIINVHGDFGRNVNLNNSEGWDHGNNQNLYTLGGSAIRPANALGKVVGKTELYGPAKQNRQYTRPTDDSYEAEPLSIASSVYQYFGAANPRVLTRGGEMNPDGDVAIDETVAGESRFW